MITVWLWLLTETVVLLGIAATLARWSYRRQAARGDPEPIRNHDEGSEIAGQR